MSRAKKNGRARQCLFSGKPIVKPGDEPKMMDWNFSRLQKQGRAARLAVLHSQASVRDLDPTDVRKLLKRGDLAVGRKRFVSSLRGHGKVKRKLQANGRTFVGLTGQVKTKPIKRRTPKEFGRMVRR